MEKKAINPPKIKVATLSGLLHRIKVERLPEEQQVFVKEAIELLETGKVGFFIDKIFNYFKTGSSINLVIMLSVNLVTEDYPEKEQILKQVLDYFTKILETKKKLDSKVAEGLRKILSPDNKLKSLSGKISELENCILGNYENSLLEALREYKRGEIPKDWIESLEKEREALLELLNRIKKGEFTDFYDIEIYRLSNQDKEFLNSARFLLFLLEHYLEKKDEKEIGKKSNVNCYIENQGLIIIRDYLPEKISLSWDIPGEILDANQERIANILRKGEIISKVTRRRKRKTHFPINLSRNIGKPEGDNKKVLNKGEKYTIFSWFKGQTILIPKETIKNLTGYDFKVLIAIMDYFIDYINTAKKEGYPENEIVQMVSEKEGIDISVNKLLKAIKGKVEGKGKSPKKYRKELVDSATKWSLIKVYGKFSDGVNTFERSTSIFDYAYLKVPSDYSMLPNAAIPPFLARAIYNGDVISFNTEVLRKLDSKLVFPYIAIRQQFLSKSRKFLKLSLEKMAILFQVTAKHKHKKKEKVMDILDGLKEHRIIDWTFEERLTGFKSEKETYFTITRGENL